MGYTLIPNQVFQKSPSESYPSPSPDTSNKEHQVVLERFTEKTDGGYTCRITSVSGHTLLDEVIRSDIDSQTVRTFRGRNFLLVIILSRKERFESKSHSLFQNAALQLHDLPGVNIADFEICVVRGIAGSHQPSKSTATKSSGQEQFHTLEVSKIRS